MFAGVHDNAQQMMERGGLVEAIGEENFFWSSDQAIVEARGEDVSFVRAYNSLCHGERTEASLLGQVRILRSLNGSSAL